MSGDLIVSERDNYMPVMSIQQAVERRKMLVEYTQACLIKEHDYGVIPNTGGKPTLYKPGAEKLCTMFGLTPRFEIVEQIERWEPDATGELLFSYVYRCTLFRGDRVIADAEGSCNSREKKYRYRNSERVCPQCGQPTIRRGSEKWGGGWYCNAKSSGCGAKFIKGDAAIERQEVGQVPNPDVADLINTLRKMSQKRAFVSAVLTGVNASEFFTVDLEDTARADESLAQDAPEAYAPPMDEAYAPPYAPRPRTQSAPVEEDPLTVRRRRALLTWKEHFTAEAITKCLPPSSVKMNGEKIHLGKTFANMSEDDLERVEIFMADPNAPVREPSAQESVADHGEPQDGEQLVEMAREHVRELAEV